MKRITFLMTGLLVLMLACDNPVNVPEDAPDVFRELVDTGIRVAEADVNAHVYLSFAIPFTIQVPGGEVEYVLETIESGEANFPGNQKNAGTCDMGTWINKNEKRTSGDMDNPHPHCVRYVETDGTTEETIYVMLEPISAKYERQGDGQSNQWRLYFTNKNGFNDAIAINVKDSEIEGKGSIEGWAVLVDDVEKRVGMITIDFAQFDNYPDFDPDCTVVGTPNSDDDGCISQLVEFSYEPRAGADGIGEEGTYTAGFLWWEKKEGWFRGNEEED